MSNVNVLTCRVVRVPGGSTEVNLENGGTVGQALEAAGVSGNNTLRFSNGQTVDRNTPVYPGAQIIVSRGARGNA